MEKNPSPEGNKSNSKPLGVTSVDEAKNQCPDVQFHGDPDRWKLIVKASSEQQRWMHSTKAMDVPGGVVLLVDTQVGGQISKALVLIPGASAEALMCPEDEEPEEPPATAPR